MSERKLQKCNICGEWFNTTDEIIEKHELKHYKPISESFSMFALMTIVDLLDIDIEQLLF